LKTQVAFKHPPELGESIDDRRRLGKDISL
jgi:hypothetical protein